MTRLTATPDPALPPYAAVLPVVPGPRVRDIPGIPGDPVPGAYALRLDADGIVFRGTDPEGVRNAAATARQILDQAGEGATIAPVTIDDRPALRVRAAMIDLARDHRYDADSMRTLVDTLAACRYNMLMLYLEGRFAIPSLGIRLPGAMTADDARALCAYARDRGIRVVPQVNLFGHMNQLLENQPVELRELPDDAYQLCPLSPDARRFVEQVVAEVSAAFDDPWVHVGCDEVVEEETFGACPRCRAFIEKEGEPALYADYIRFLHDTVAHHGKRLAIWGDGLLRLPDAVRRVPTDVVIFDWHYNPGLREFPSLDMFADAGFDVVVSGLAGTVDDFYRDANEANLGAFFSFAADRDALGGCACVWEMKDRRIWLQHAFPIAWGGECLWTGDDIDPSFPDRFGRVILGAMDPVVLDAWRKMPAMRYRPACRALESDTGELPRLIQEGPAAEALMQSAIDAQIPLRSIIAACDRAMPRARRPDLLRALRLSARQHLVAAVRVETGARDNPVVRKHRSGTGGDSPDFPREVDAAAADWSWAIDHHGMSSVLWQSTTRLRDSR